MIFKGDPGLLHKMTNATYILKWDDENSVDIVMSDEEYVEDHLPYFQYLRCAEMGCPEVVALSLCDQGKHWTCQQHRCCQDVELFPDIISSTSAFRTPDQRTTAGMLSELSDASSSVLSPPTLCDMDSDNCGGSCNSSDATTTLPEDVAFTTNQVANLVVNEDHNIRETVPPVPEDSVRETVSDIQPLVRDCLSDDYPGFPLTTAVLADLPTLSSFLHPTPEILPILTLACFVKDAKDCFTAMTIHEPVALNCFGVMREFQMLRLRSDSFKKSTIYHEN